MAGDWKQHVAVHDNGLVFNEHAVRMVLIGINPMNGHAVGLKGVNVGLLLGSSQFNVGRTRTEIPCEGLRVGRRDAADQRPFLLVQPHGGHG
jgi:hypothetical protein